MRYYEGFITSLKPGDVFVFGSNTQGYHGMGSAGYATCYSTKGLSDYYSKPFGWKGKWNVKGVGEGYQEGTEGASYALPTVKSLRPRETRTIEEIQKSIKSLYVFAAANPNKTFYIGYTNTNRLLCGYTIKQLVDCFLMYSIPENVVFSISLKSLIEN